jgi:hypothetical protein
MANELQIMPNPDNVPGSVTSGYQIQNINILALQTGLDTTEPFDNGDGEITIPAGGIVELNGVMFKIASAVTLTKGNANTAYWIAITDNGCNGTASAGLVTRPGTWNPAKQGCYLPNGKRTLNWVSLGKADNLQTDVEIVKNLRNKGCFDFHLPKGWYCVKLASGLGGGNGAGRARGGGGVPQPTGYKQVEKILFYDGSGSVAVKVGGNGFNGGNGGYGGNRLGGDSGGGGGGGGCGRGGETSACFGRAFIATGEQPGGNGGNGGNGTGKNEYAGGGGGGGGGENGGAGGLGGGDYAADGGDGGASGGGGGSAFESPSASGGASGGANGRDGWTNTTPSGGGGGGMGAHGDTRPDGDPAAGYCQIYALQN